MTDASMPNAERDADGPARDAEGGEEASGPGIAAGEDEAVRVWRGLRSLVLERGDRRREVCEVLGVSFAMAKALRTVAEEGELSISLLATRLLTDAPYTSLLVDGLVKRGFVTRTPDPSDRRRKLVRPTADGLRAAATAAAILDTPPPALRDLPPSDLATLSNLLTHLNTP
ncbi:MarR family winged helix-turn-helix transcriptional regulator [Actinocorallia sp. A-T 12471]|uniref:MarR family winged helix-turn-helix transcriptional regulator n=1 Tax=Actinocorallia sp. A-T 12471 TaxID=3089813 RepID=UPI0029CD0966|nr:MarR family transcriptional regulator [Actinocorallia sp. A-T 12471]MDX6738776.1 MarR family transcriptional regulator [Actinocorallia sp. A-T 12471]